MPLLGVHTLIDGKGADPALLNDLPFIEQTLGEVCALVDATIVARHLEPFTPLGATATFTLKESHLTIHTWPELGMFTADLFFCRNQDTAQAISHLLSAFKTTECRVTRLERGTFS